MRKYFLLAAVFASCFILSACRARQAESAPKSMPTEKWVVCKESWILLETAEEKGVTGSSDSEGADGKDSLLVDSCRIRNYLIMDTCSEDRVGRCVWSGSLYTERNGTFEPIRNSDMFNERLPELERRINDSLRAEAKRDLTDTSNAECISDEASQRMDSLPEYSINDLHIETISEKEMYFTISTGIYGGACAPIWDLIASIPYAELMPYIK